jgi:ABC-type lipoprotein release transport system permease subunit
MKNQFIALPFSYVSRSLLREPIKLLQKVLGAALVVSMVLAAGMFNQGMDRMLRNTGDPDNVLFIGAGSEDSVERSEVAKRAEGLIAGGVRGIESRMNLPSVSGEVQYMGMVDFPDGARGQGLLRGVTPSVFQVRPSVRLLEGRFPGSGEILVGVSAHRALGVPESHLAVGKTLSFDDQEFRISGRFEAPATVLESEMWLLRGDLMTLTQRETLSAVLVRLADPAAFAAADLFSKQRLDLELVAIRESDYYAQLSRFYAPIRWMTWVTTAMIAMGAAFGGVNLLYAAFSARMKELATLQSIGFSRLSLFIALLQESLLSSLAGAWVSVLFAWFFLHGNQVFFSVGSFSLELTPSLLLAAVVAALALAVVGTLPPALRCLRTPLPTALRAS